MVNIGVEAFSAGLADRHHPAERSAAICRQHLRLQDRKDQRRPEERRPQPPRIDRTGAKRKRQKFLEGVTIGDKVQGTVKNLTDFGAFIDLDGMDGLLHITDMTWGRLGHPSELLKVGQQLDVIVLDINQRKSASRLVSSRCRRIPVGSDRRAIPGRSTRQRQDHQSRSLRRVRGTRGRCRRSHPRLRVVLDEAHHPPADILDGRPGSRSRRAWREQESRKFSFGLRQLEPNPWDEIEKKFTIGSRVKARFATSPPTVRSSSWKTVSTE